VGIRIAQRKLINEVVKNNHGTWNLVVRIFVKNVQDSNAVLVRSIMRQARSSRYDKKVLMLIQSVMIKVKV
jgi:chorismate mutase